MSIKPKNLIKGQFFYENAYGKSVLFIVMESPTHVDEERHTGWMWKAKCIHNGEITSFFESTKYRGYALSLSYEPEYTTVFPRLKTTDETGTDT